MHLRVIFLDVKMNAYCKNYCKQACITNFRYIFLVSLLFRAPGKRSMEILIRLSEQKTWNLWDYEQLQVHALAHSCYNFLSVNSNSLCFSFTKTFSTSIVVTVNVKRTTAKSGCMHILSINDIPVFFFCFHTTMSLLFNFWFTNMLSQTFISYCHTICAISYFISKVQSYLMKITKKRTNVLKGVQTQNPCVPKTRLKFMFI